MEYTKPLESLDQRLRCMWLRASADENIDYISNYLSVPVVNLLPA